MPSTALPLISSFMGLLCIPPHLFHEHCSRSSHLHKCKDHTIHPPSNTMGDGTANACPIMLISKCKQIDRAGHCMQLKCPSADGKDDLISLSQGNDWNKTPDPSVVLPSVTLQAFWWWTVDCVCTCKCPFSDFRAMLFLPHLSSAGGIV